MPVNAISNWLNRNSDDQFNSTGRDNEERKLLMNKQIRIQNAVEIRDQMKMVITCYFIFNIKIVKKVYKFYNRRISFSDPETKMLRSFSANK